MFYSNSLNLIQVGGGTQVKQGDLGSKFSYKLANEKDQELDDFDKEVARINLVLDDKIVFTTTATVDNSTVTFNIDQALPVGLYFLEIKIRDYIFPSDKQTIIFVDSGAAVYKELVPNYDVNMTLDGILSDLSQKGIDINDLKTKMSAIYNNALDDHAEITTARGEFDTLLQHIMSISANAIAADKKASSKVDKGGAGQITYSMLDQTIREKFTGGSVAVVGENAVSTNNIVNGSVTNEKLKGVAINVQYFPSYDGPAIYDPVTKILDFNCLTEGHTATVLFNGAWIQMPVGTTVNLNLAPSRTANIIFDLASGGVSAQSGEKPIPENCTVIGRVRFPSAPNSQKVADMFSGPIADNITIKGKVLFDSNYTFIPSRDGKPWFDPKRKRVHFNCITDRAFINYNNQSIQLTKDAWCSVEAGGSTGTIFIDVKTGEIGSQPGFRNDVVGKLILAQWRVETDGKYTFTGNVPIQTLSTTSKKSRSDDSIKFIAHRGYNRIAPEESPEAYLLAYYNGLDGWECDVHFTADNIAVITHDDTINNIARNPDGTPIGSTIAIKDTNYSDLLNYDFGIYKSDYFAGNKIMKFEDFVKMARKLDIDSIHVELKETFTQEQRQKLYDIVKSQRMLKKCVWYSFFPDELRGMARIDDKIPLAVLGSTYTPSNKALMQELSNGVRTVSGSFNYWEITADNAKAALDDGFDLSLWVCDSDYSINKFSDIPVTAYMTNGLIDIETALVKF